MMISSNVEEKSDECRTLLGDLKSIVESLLVVNTTSVWSTVGGLSRLVNQLEKILSHGLIDRDGDFWPFILNLRHLQPTLTPLLDKLNKDATTQGVQRSSLWLKSSLEQLTVTGQLQILLASGCMQQYYHDYALICHENYTQALLTCLGAIEHNDSCLLAELDYALFQNRRSITRPDSAYSTRSVSGYAHQFPVFIEKQNRDVVSLSPQHALGSTPPAKFTESAKDKLNSVLERDSTGATEPLMNIPTTALTDSSSIESSRIVGPVVAISDITVIPEPTEPRVENQEYQLSSEGARTEEQAKLYIPDSMASEMHWTQGRDYSIQEDTIMENDAKLFTPSPTESPWDRTNGKLLFESSGDFDDISRSGEHTQRRGATSADSNDYQVNLLAAGGQNGWEKAASQFGSVKTRATRRKLSRDDGLTPHEKQLKRRNAHKRWHSAQVTETEAKRIMEEASRYTQIDGQSSSLPEDRWYHGIQSPVVDGYFPQPSEGESLMSFLSSQDFATCPELDRLLTSQSEDATCDCYQDLKLRGGKLKNENAHFCISEAIISAVEQIKCKQLAQGSENESDGSDEEIQALKQRIRIRRKERRRDRVLMEETQDSSPESDASDVLDEIPLPSSDSELSDNDGLEDLELTDTMGSNLTSMQEGELSTSLASLYSDADLQKSLSNKAPESQPISLLSAESIALSLLKKFSLKHLPRASELEWMVSEKDAPQALLPLPQSVPISPDDGENADLLNTSNKSMRLRGNMEWAPPRAQLIFNIHPVPKRKLLIAKQNYRCAGCGMKIERGFLKRLRYCHYLGKFFCQCCHTSNTTVIPSRILRKWDFTKVPVSNFSLEFLKKIHNDPLFNIRDVNPYLYKKVRTLQNCQDLRCQLFSLKDFIRTCRLSERSLFSLYDQEPSHLLSETETYSMADLMRVRSGEMEKMLSRLVQLGIQHVIKCELCQAKGFICEICKNQEDIIFPFELNKTVQCPDCGSCYHQSCFEEMSDCPKCSRIKKRRQLLAAQISEDSSNQSDSTPVSPDESTR